MSRRPHTRLPAAAMPTLRRSGPAVRCMISSVGFLAAAGLFVPAAETRVSMADAVKYMSYIYLVFSLQFLFLAEFFHGDAFSTKPKDKFGLVFTRMFGWMGLITLWLSTLADPADVYKVFCVCNVGIRPHAVHCAHHRAPPLGACC